MKLTVTTPVLSTEVMDRPKLRGYLHAIAAALSVVALVWLVRVAHSVEATVAAWVYGAAAILCYVASSSYHIAARTERARAFMQRLDHSMIYVLIAGTFTPVGILAMHGWWRWLIVAAFWLVAAFGIGLLVPRRPRLPRFGIALYIILGWGALAALPSLWHRPAELVLVGVAGVLYTLGAILFGWKRPRLHTGWFGYHEFWHAMGVAAGALLFLVNLNLIAGAGS